MTAPILTIRGREFSEPMPWAIGGAVAFLTPLPSILAMPYMMVWTVSDGPVLPALLALATPGLLTWWALARPNRLSIRAWSVGIWLTAFIATFFLMFEVLGRIENVLPLTDWLWTGITVVGGLAVLFIASPFYAWAAFMLGQRWFAHRIPSPTPTEVGARPA
jgi:hypothetical protein